tara:strand:- start:36 stop:437 length:402 start_codon:yes stop_codon:yes gene_type:complete
MLKGIVLAIVAIFIAWSALDFIIHGMLLKETYEATAHLWRTMQETNMMLMHAVTLAIATCFVLLYERCVSEKSVSMGLKLGVLFGLAAGIMSASAYVYMPISFTLAIDWFVGTLVKFVVAGWLVGLFVKSEAV